MFSCHYLIFIINTFICRIKNMHYLVTCIFTCMMQLLCFDFILSIYIFCNCSIFFIQINVLSLTLCLLFCTLLLWWVFHTVSSQTCMDFCLFVCWLLQSRRRGPTKRQSFGILWRVLAKTHEVIYREFIHFFPFWSLWRSSFFF